MEAPSKGTVRTVEIGASEAGQRIDNYLFRVAKGVPKSHIYRLLRSGQVRVNSKRVDASFRLSEGDRMRLPPMRTAHGQAPTEWSLVTARRLQARLPVLFDEEGLLAVNKPSGMAVHGGSGISQGVVEALRASQPSGRFLELVHRLDRDTSGLLLLARKRSVLTALHAALREGLVQKEYLALVCGDWPWVEERLIERPLRKYLTPSGERRVSVSDTLGQPARTRAVLLGRCNRQSLLHVTLETGRTHQIRVHLASEGFPVCGDDKYGSEAINDALAETGLKRLFLHAWRLSLPWNGSTLALCAPLAEELVEFLTRAGFDTEGVSGPCGSMT